jgi:hypothetical protein
VTATRNSRWRVGVILFCLALVAQAFVGATTASAQASRTWVSGVGDDANPCSRTAPCKTFQGAYNKTATGGEISVLDPGPYGAVTLAKSMTISGNGNATSILAAGTHGITVNGADIVVRIRGLEINGNKTAGNYHGIRFLQGKSLTVDDVDVYNFSGSGLHVTAPGRLVVRDSRLDNNTGAGISLDVPSGLARATIVRTGMDLNGTGLLAGANSRVAVRECSTSNNTAAGIRATSSGIAVDNCTVQANAQGIVSESASSVRVRNTTVVDNATGLSFTAGSALLSGGGNTVEGNGANGAFNGSYTPK